MKRNTLNLLIDAATAVVMGGMVATGLLVRLVLPPGSGSRKVVWGLGRHDWGDLHFWLAVAAGAVVLLHVALHWQWVCVTVLRVCRRGGGGVQPAPSAARRNAAGAALVAAMVVLFGGFVWAARLGVRDAAVPERSGGGAAVGIPTDTEHDGVRGSMTLAEVAERYGVTVEALRARLDLPADASADEQLGRLAKTYGFSMQRVRRSAEAARGQPGR